MKTSNSLLLTFCCFLFIYSHGQPRIGGPCEGCEGIYEYGTMPLDPMDTLPEFENTDPKMIVKGTVYQHDGKTPGPDVILYVYHTNRKGIYPTKGDEKGWARRHGYIRGWVKTGADGKYTFYTFRPGAYPSRAESEHIHIIVKEPDKNEYWMDSYEFTDDPLLDPSEKRGEYGGSGIVTPKRSGDYLLVERDLILGKNVPNYSK